MFQITEVTNGFKLEEILEIPDNGAFFYSFTHVKTGAKLGWIKNDDENKTFSVAFKTLPTDSTGMFHILEHSVLQGSEHYPVKSPMVELMKGSLQTFVNAITFADKTVYPISSRNEKDLENMTRVYLDAVFHPLIYKNEKIFQQEGWHFESETADSDLYYNGVVLNEMRGSYSSVDQRMYTEMQASLFPDNCYHFNSGGDPMEIPQLTYEVFLEAHRKHYHPSNAYFIMDGDMDLKKILPIIDGVISEYEKQDIELPIPMQAPVQTSEEHTFQVDAEAEHQSYLGLGFAVGQYDDLKRSTAAKILADYLTGSYDAPLKKTILESGYGYDIHGGYGNGMQQHFIFLMIRNMNATDRSAIEEMLRDKLKAIYEEGLDEERLDSILSQYEFMNRMQMGGRFPAGVVNALTVLESWLYGGSPVLYLNQSMYFEELREEIENGTFKEYLKEIFLDNAHRSSVLMKADAGHMAREAQKEEDGLLALQNAMSAEEREKLWNKQIELKDWQSVPSTPEQIATLPSLKVSDISPDPISVHTEVLEDGTIWHQAATRGIAYLRLYFELHPETEEELAATTFLSSVVGRIPLKNMELSKLETETNKKFGFFNTYIQVGEDKVWYVVDVSYLQSKENEAKALIRDILSESDFTASGMIAEYLRQEAEGIRQNMINNGQQFASIQAKSSSSRASYYVNCASGPVYAEWLEKMTAKSETEADAFSSMICAAFNRALKGSLLVSMTSTEKAVGTASEWRDVFASMAAEDTERSVFDAGHKLTEAHMKNSHLGIPIPAQTAYAAMAGNLKNSKASQTGSWSVFAKIASMDYIWNEIRVLGGAYGAYMQVDEDMNLVLFTYRDPNPGRSLDTFTGVSDFMETYSAEHTDIDRLIIGTIAGTEPLFTPYTMGKRADSWYLSGVTDEMRRQKRTEILNTDVQTLARLAGELREILPTMDTAVVANTDILEKLEGKIHVRPRDQR